MSTLGNMSKDVVGNYINNQKYNALQKERLKEAYPETGKKVSKLKNR